MATNNGNNFSDDEDLTEEDLAGSIIQLPQAKATNNNLLLMLPKKSLPPNVLAAARMAVKIICGGAPLAITCAIAMIRVSVATGRLIGWSANE